MKKLTALAGSGHTQPKASGSTHFTELLPVSIASVGNKKISVVSGRNLHAALGVGRVFASWFNTRVAQYGFVTGVDYIKCNCLIIEQFTPKRVKIQKAGRPESDYWVSTNMGKELGMVERTQQGRAIRQYLIQCEDALHGLSSLKVSEFRHQLRARLSAANDFKPMCAALELARAEIDKSTEVHHYTTESNMLSRLVLGGMTAKQWAKANEISGDPRDNMSAKQLEHLSYLELSNITLIELGWDYPQRKSELMRLSQRWLSKHMGAH